MKQIFQDLKTGEIEMAEVPCPQAAPGQLLIRTRASLVSRGTERMLLEFGAAGWLGKARQQPERVRQVWESIQSEGLIPTVEAVRAKLDRPLPLGYCNVGVVLDAGEGVAGWKPGDRAVSSGPHAEVVRVLKNLCARIPEGVSDEAATFAVMGSISLQGLRLARPTLGESVAVIGLGLVGLLAVQLLRANGCRVLGVDLDGDRLALARGFGAETVDLSRSEDPAEAAMAFTSGRGMDAVLIAASAKSNEPVRQAAQMSRKRGRIVLVGVVGLELSRAAFYEKELSFQVSTSFGPGRYDPAYEEGGHDYPLGYVRWTAQRNIGAVLEMMESGKLDVSPLVSHRFGFGRALEAYELVKGDAPTLGIVFGYPPEAASGDLRRATVRQAPASSSSKTASPVAGFIGAGNHAAGALLPALRGSGTRLKTIASSGGLSGVHAGRKFGFEESTTDAAALIADDEIDTVFIATRHDSHCDYVCRALEAGKHVFVEKPIALSRDELSRIESAYLAARGGEGGPVLMAGFNRRFAPQIRKMKTLLEAVGGPKTFVMTVNAGEVPAEHWVHDERAGGGRIVGEGCHFIDLLRHLAGAPIGGVESFSLGGDSAGEDKVSIVLRFADGSMGTVHYLASGHRSFPRERLEVFCAGRVLQLENFRRLRGYGWPGFKKMVLWRQDKGIDECVKAFLRSIREGAPSPIPFEELAEVARASFDARDSLKKGRGGET